MIITTENIAMVIANGAGVKLKSSGRTVEQLVLLAANSKTRGVSLTILVDRVLTAESMAMIAANGGGHVIFDLTA